MCNLSSDFHIYKLSGGFCFRIKGKSVQCNGTSGSEQKDGTNGQFWARLLLEFNSNISSFICFQDFIQRLLLSSRSMLSCKNTSLYKRNGNTEVRCRSPFHFTLISGGKRQGTHEERDTAVFFLLLPQVQFPQAA